MGAFLSEPVTEKVSVDEEHSRLNFGVCSMQGWRFTQEDNHSCCPKLDEDSALFGVYDGHGGAEVSRYVASLLPDYVLARECWEKGEVGKALSEAFLALDAHLGSRKGLKVLKRLAAEDDAALDHEKKSSAEDDAESEDGSEENVRNLFKEAKMPLQLLMAKYGQALAACQNEEDEAGEGSPTGSKSAKGGASSVGGDAASSEEGGSSAAVKKGEEGGGSGSSEDAAAPKENGLPEETVEGAKATKNGSGGRSKLRSRPVRMLMTDEDDDEEDDSSDEEYDENSSSLMEEEAEGESSGDEEDDDDDEDGDDDEESLEDSISTSDKFALNMLQGPGLDSGCTAVVAVVRKGGVLYVANAGDSRCILSRKGRAIDMSVDHKPEDEAESERIKAAGGEVTSEGRVNGGLNLSRALGDHAYKQGTDVGARQQMISALPDVRRVQLRKDEDEFMLLACDGIWNSMTSQEVVDFVRERLYKDAPKGDSAEDVQERRKAAKGVKLSEICGDMFETCLAPNTLGDGTGCDNMTAVLVTFRDDLWDGSAVDVVAKVEKKGKEGVELKADSKKEEDSSDSKKDEEDEKEDDDEEDHGIVLLTPPPSPPPVTVEGEEEEETSEEEEEEEEDEEEEEEEGEEDALAEEVEEDKGVEEDEVSNGRSGKGKGSKRQTDTSTDTPLPKLKKRKVERAAEEDGEKEADTVSPAS